MYDWNHLYCLHSSLSPAFFVISSSTSISWIRNIPSNIAAACALSPAADDTSKQPNSFQVVGHQRRQPSLCTGMKMMPKWCDDASFDNLCAACVYVFVTLVDFLFVPFIWWNVWFRPRTFPIFDVIPLSFECLKFLFVLVCRHKYRHATHICCRAVCDARGPFYICR